MTGQAGLRLAANTQDAPGTVTRLIEMGVRPFIVASSLRCVLAQRLVRLLCDHCKRPARLPQALLEDNGFAVSETVEAFEPVGCGRCSRTGYRARVSVFEVMPVDESIRAAIATAAIADEIRALALNAGMRSLRETAWPRVVAGEPRWPGWPAG